MRKLNEMMKTVVIGSIVVVILYDATTKVVEKGKAWMGKHIKKGCIKRRCEDGTEMVCFYRELKLNNLVIPLWRIDHKLPRNCTLEENSEIK